MRQKPEIISCHGPSHPYVLPAPFLTLDPLHLPGVDQTQTSSAPGPVQHGWQGSCQVHLPPLALLQPPDRDSAADSHLPCPAAAEAGAQRPHQNQAHKDYLHKTPGWIVVLLPSARYTGCTLLLLCTTDIKDTAQC